MIKKNNCSSILNEYEKNNVSPLLNVYFEFMGVKRLFRQGWIKKGIPLEECESVGDHILGVALISWLICEEYRKDLDILKVLRLSLIHDLPEAVVGDITPHDGISEEAKTEMEKEGAARIFSHLPSPEKYTALFREYVEGRTKEARFVREIDKLEMVLQAYAYEKDEYEGLDEFFHHTDKILNDENIRALFSEINRLRETQRPGLSRNGKDTS